MVSEIIVAMIPVVLGLICLIWPEAIYTFYRDNKSSSWMGKDNNDPDWLPVIPTTKAIIVVRLIGVFTLAFMFIILKTLFTEPLH